MTTSTQTWTKKLVQEHAQTAVAVELYTLPFYLTALTSIKDTTDQIYKTILSVCIEEMLHLQLAANLCLAVGTKPNFTAPQYGTPIKFLKPNDPDTKHNSLINAKLDALNKTTLGMMLDIETPSEFEPKDHTTPIYPYLTLGDLYDALLHGIKTVGLSEFPWTTKNQQYLVGNNRKKNEGGTKEAKNLTPFPQIITCYLDAKTAVKVISEQGEGKTMKPAPKARSTMPYFIETQFPVPYDYQLTIEPHDTTGNYQYAHFGRFVWVQNQVAANGYPEVYTGTSVTDGNLSSDQEAVSYELIEDFKQLMDSLNKLWDEGEASSVDIWAPMTATITKATACWKANVVPQWSA